jgi:hypothetical protein
MVDPRTGVLSEAKVVTGVDDHSRYCVIAKVVPRATSRAVCLAFAEALARFGVPEEVLTDNGKVFTDRFGKNGEVLFDKICRKNGITHRLTQPASPNQNGKVERFHGTFRPEFLKEADAFESVAAAQAAVDTWVGDYNTDRPHQALDPKLPVTPGERFTPVPVEARALLELWVPPSLTPVLDPTAGPDPDAAEGRDSQPGMETSPVADIDEDGPGQRSGWTGAAIEFDRVVPASGNLMLSGRQFWLGPARAGVTVRFWADVEVIHLLIGGARVKSIRSHLSETDLRRLVATGAVNAGPSPLPGPEDGTAIEVDRVVGSGGTVSLGQQVILAAEILAGRQVGIRIEPGVLMFFDLETRELLRTRPNPLSTEQVRRLRGARRAGPPPRPGTEPVRVQRRADNSGTLMVVGQKIALGRDHRHQVLTVTVSETTLTVHLGDGDERTFRRTNDKAVRNIKPMRPRTATSIS